MQMVGHNDERNCAGMASVILAFHCSNHLPAQGQFEECRLPLGRASNYMIDLVRFAVSAPAEGLGASIRSTRNNDHCQIMSALY